MVRTDRLLKERPRLEVERLEDDQLLAARAKTDREAFGLLYDRYLDRVYGYCRRRMATREEAEDATSQVFIKALAAMGRYRAESPSFAAWIFTIAHNVVIDHGKAATRRSRLPWRPERQPADDPMESAVAAEAARELRSMLVKLPPDQAEVIQLRLSGLSDQEIAIVLGRSHGAIRIAQHRAIKRLRLLFGVKHPDSNHGKP